jgi:hypothetical protein
LEGDAVEAVNIYREVFASLDPDCKADPTRATLTSLVLTVTDGKVRAQHCQARVYQPTE